MIKQLTPEQEAMIPDYVAKWVGLGLSTKREPASVQRRIVKRVYQDILLARPPRAVICVDSPVAAWIAVSILRSQAASSQIWSEIGSRLWWRIDPQTKPQIYEQVRSHVQSQIQSEIESNVWSQIRSEIDPQIYLKVWSQVWSQMDSQIRRQVNSQIWSNVRSGVESQVKAQLRSDVSTKVGFRVRSQIDSQGQSQVKEFVWPYLDGHWSAGYMAWCDYWSRIGVVTRTQALSTYLETARLGLVYPFPDVAVVCGKPSELHRESNGNLHAEGRMAVEYADGWGIWCLHGVRVPQWLAETPSGQIPANRIVKVDNAEVRREFVRKVGLERICHELGGKVLHRQTVRLRTPEQDNWPCRYELIALQLGEGVVRHVLKMPNASLPDVWHVEYVPTECRTVEQAMNFRLHRTEEQIDDRCGAEWYLHGDVIIKPKGVQTQKRWPALIA